MENRIKKYRCFKGYSQRQLAMLIGCSQQHIARIEQEGYNPRVEISLKVAKALDTSINNLFSL